MPFMQFTLLFLGNAVFNVGSTAGDAPLLDGKSVMDFWTALSLLAYVFCIGHVWGLARVSGSTRKFWCVLLS